MKTIIYGLILVLLPNTAMSQSVIFCGKNYIVDRDKKQLVDFMRRSNGLYDTDACGEVEVRIEDFCDEEYSKLSFIFDHDDDGFISGFDIRLPHEATTLNSISYVYKISNVFGVFRFSEKFSDGYFGGRRTRLSVSSKGNGKLSSFRYRFHTYYGFDRRNKIDIACNILD